MPVQYLKDFHILSADTENVFKIRRAGIFGI